MVENINSNKKLINNIDIKNVSNVIVKHNINKVIKDSLIQSYLLAIDNKNKEKI